MNPLNFVNNFFKGIERLKLIQRTPGIVTDYENEYPEFRELEENHAIIKKECENLLSMKEDINDVQGMAGDNTVGGIHNIEWKSFMFKAGSFIEENCELCPETARMLKKIPGIRQTFFSILYPNQYIKPHRGYYYGFLRYHLGVIIPNNNKDKKCWIRVNEDVIDNRNFDKNSLEKGSKYYWKNGEGVIFNDNYLHDAANETDEIRVIMWIYVERKFPFWLRWINKFFLFVAYQTKSAKKVAENAKFQPKKNL